MSTLAIRIPLEDGEENIISQIDKNEVNLLDLIQMRFEDVTLNVETGDNLISH